MGWVLFLAITGRERESMENNRWFVAVVALGAGAGALIPWKGVGERERTALRRYVFLNAEEMGRRLMSER